MSKYTPFHNQSIEEDSERKHQLREHSCPVGCHQKSMYPPSQYHEYECEHQKQHKTRERLFTQWRWLQGHIADLENQGKDLISYKLVWIFGQRNLLQEKKELRQCHTYIDNGQ